MRMCRESQRMASSLDIENLSILHDDITQCKELNGMNFEVVNDGMTSTPNFENFRPASLLLLKTH